MHARWIPVLVALGVVLTGDARLGTAQELEKPLTELTTQIQNIALSAAPSMVRVVRIPTLGETVAQGKNPTRIIGSGVSLGDGMILTSSGVTGSATEVLVFTADGTQTRARVLGTDRRTNVAVLEIDRKNVPPVPVAQEGLIFPGDLVVAVGFAPTLGPRSSFGTVVLAEEGPSLGYTEVDMLHATAPPFPGVSGGILLNQRGEMVGMIFGRMDLDRNRIVSSAGLVSGFLDGDLLYTTRFETVTLALPVGMAVDLSREIIEQGQVQRGFLGLQLELNQVSDRPAETQSMMRVHGLVPQGPAHVGGLMAGDVVLKYGHAEISSPEDLSYLVAATRAGSTVPIEVLRRGTRKVFYITIQQAPEVDWVPEMDAFISVDAAQARVAPAVR